MQTNVLVQEYLARGGKITICKPGKARAPAALRQDALAAKPGPVPNIKHILAERANEAEAKRKRLAAARLATQ